MPRVSVITVLLATIATVLIRAAVSDVSIAFSIIIHVMATAGAIGAAWSIDSNHVTVLTEVARQATGRVICGVNLTGAGNKTMNFEGCAWPLGMVPGSNGKLRPSTTRITLLVQVLGGVLVMAAQIGSAQAYYSCSSDSHCQYSGCNNNPCSPSSSSWVTIHDHVARVHGYRVYLCISVLQVWNLFKDDRFVLIFRYIDGSIVDGGKHTAPG